MRRCAIPVYYLVANAEASSNLARYDGVRYGARADASSLTEMYYKTRAPLRRRGQAAHHDRHLRAERRLLRRVLREGAESAGADPEGLRRGVHAGGCGGAADEPDGRVQGSGRARRIRSRCTWRTCSPRGEPRRPAGDQHSVRRDEGESAGGTSVDGQAVRRGNAPADGRRAGAANRYATTAGAGSL